MRRIGVLISGTGSNMEAIVAAARQGIIPDARVAVVVSNRKAARGLARAISMGIPAIYHPLAPYRREGLQRSAYDADLAAMLAPFRLDLIAQAGWMHILSMAFLQHYPDRVLNIHPALPGAFPGTDAIRRAYEAFLRGEVQHTGVMIHRVPDETVDEGPVVAQEVVPIEADDTLASLEQRVHETEHRLYPWAIAQELARLGA